jgi:AcrR family transcriptional regulator
MAPSGTSSQPQQERSRRTQERLLRAAEAVFAKRGIGRATVGEICAHAGVAVGTFYGRFRDKDALLRAYYERFFQRGVEAVAADFSSERWKGRPASEIVAAWVAWRVERYDRRRRLLRALLLWVRAHPSPEFRRQATRARPGIGGAFMRLLLERRAELRHPDPEQAARFVLVLVESTTLDALLFAGHRGPDLLFDAKELQTELTRAALAYLGLPQPPAPRARAAARVRAGKRAHAGRRVQAGKRAQAAGATQAAGRARVIGGERAIHRLRGPKSRGRGPRDR